MPNEQTKLERLRCDAVHDEPRDYDWSEGYGESWEFYDAEDCEECGGLITSSKGQCDKCDNDPDFEGPMMNYFYELPSDIDPDDAAETIKDLPLCIVYLTETEEYGLALTGGGMDLSWEICEAFVLLGYLPPFHFCRLPRMAGKRLDYGNNALVLDACKKTCEVLHNWIVGTESDLKQLEYRLEEAAEAADKVESEATA
jgi:hypothetical protein